MAPVPDPEPDRDPPWGTPAAKKLVLERLRRRIEENSKKERRPRRDFSTCSFHSNSGQWR